MGKSLLIEKEAKSKQKMEVYNNPNKRIRLDLPTNIPNDDLWGEDLTAEEFDMLEVQATQSHQQDDTSSTFVQPFPGSAFENNLALKKADEAKQQMYELEGKVKLLTQSLEKASKDLKDEKLKNVKLINEKMQQSLAKENNLRKEIKKIESALQFKDQEMKSVYEKVHLLETQLQEKKEKPELPTNKSSHSFLDKFQFKTETPIQNSPPCNENKPNTSRKHKLLIDTPGGEVKGSDIITTILCNRLSATTPQNSTLQTQPSLDYTTKHCHLSAVSILRLSSDQQTEELFDYFSGVFSSYLEGLRSSNIPTVNSNVNSPLRRRYVKQDRSVVISCLKDLSCIISSSQFLSQLQRCRNEERNSNEVKMVSVPSTSTVQPGPVSNTKTDEPVDKVSLLLKTLISLSRPDSYPVNYFKSEEIELSLSCLVSWSALSHESFVPLMESIFHPSIICYEDIAPLFLSLKLITNLCIQKEFVPVLLHKSDFCLMCAISSLLIQKIPQNPLKFTTIMLQIENLLSLLFTVYNSIELKLDSSPCSTMVFQGAVISLCKFYNYYENGNSDLMVVLKKGFTLIYQLSRYLPNCKERRASFEHSYISLVCGMLTLSKENTAFKEFYDLVHDLWDFQEDTSEFDLDDSSEESSPMGEVTSQSGH